MLDNRGSRSPRLIIAAASGRRQQSHTHTHTVIWETTVMYFIWLTDYRQDSFFFKKKEKQIVSSSISCTSVYLGVFSRCRTARFSPAKRFCGKSSCQLFFSLFCCTVCCTAPLTIKLPTWDSLPALCTVASSCKTCISFESARICRWLYDAQTSPTYPLAFLFLSQNANQMHFGTKWVKFLKNVVGMEEPNISSYRLTSLTYQTQDFDCHLISTSPQASSEIRPCRSTETNPGACSDIYEWLTVWVCLSLSSKNFQVHTVWQCLSVLWPCEFPGIILTHPSSCVRASLTISRITNESLMTTPGYISACSCALDSLLILTLVLVLIMIQLAEA